MERYKFFSEGPDYYVIYKYEDKKSGIRLIDYKLLKSSDLNKFKDSHSKSKDISWNGVYETYLGKLSGTDKRPGNREHLYEYRKKSFNDETSAKKFIDYLKSTEFRG